MSPITLSRGRVVVGGLAGFSEHRGVGADFFAEDKSSSFRVVVSSVLTENAFPKPVTKINYRNSQH